jgi:excinuclease ABC subunit A
MNFLPDVYVPCEVCKGARYNRDTLEVHYKGRTISEILDMPIEEAATFFEAIPAIHRHLKTLVDVGLGYVRLGQPAPTLSGGEAQRVKLASELQKRSTGRTVYVLDEPTTGLHFEDIRKLLGVLDGLVDKGNTVVVIEHNLDVIKTADWIIDMGPEGGHKGGTVLAAGTPEELADTPESYTGQWLRSALGLTGSASPAAAGGPAVARAATANGTTRAANGNGATRAANGTGRTSGTGRAAGNGTGRAAGNGTGRAGGNGAGVAGARAGRAAESEAARASEAGAKASRARTTRAR